MWHSSTPLTSIMDLWLHDQISDMIHHGMIMADIVWPIFKWPLNDHGHGLAENNLERSRASNFWTFESICISQTVAGVFLPLYFVPGMKCLHAVAVGWMYLIGVMEVPQPRRYWTLSKRLTILKIYSVTTYKLCQKGSQYVAIDWELDTIGDFTPQDPFPCVPIV